MLPDMSQHTDGMAQHTDDMSSETRRFSVDEAAAILGISTGAVRNRLSRGTLDSVKVDGTVYVLLPTAMLRDTDRNTDDISRDTADIPHDSEALISAKDETIRLLQQQLEVEREASSELRRIIAGLVQRVPELEPAQEAPESPETASAGAEGVEETPLQTEKRPWWRRMFG
jgi:hypothetical protein